MNARRAKIDADIRRSEREAEPLETLRLCAMRRSSIRRANDNDQEKSDRFVHRFVTHVLSMHNRQQTPAGRFPKYVVAAN